MGSLATLRFPIIASGLFLWNDIFQPLVFARHPGFFPSAYFVFGVLVFAFFTGWFRGIIKPRFGPYFFALTGVLTWILISTSVSPFQHVVWTEFVTLIKYLIPLLIIYMSVQSLRDLKILAATLSASVGVWGAHAGAHCLRNGVNTDLSIPGGQMMERNDFAAAIVGTIPILIFFALSYSGRFKMTIRIGIWGAVVLCLCAIFFSLSRGASLGLAFSTLLYLLYVSKKKMRDGFILASLAITTYFILPQDWHDRMATIELGAEQSEGSAKSRMNLMLGALRASVDHPIFGLGPGGWLEVAVAYCGDDHNPHSIYMVLSSESGFVGLAIYLGIMFMTYWRLNKVIKIAMLRGDVEIFRLSAALIMSIFGLISAMTFLNRPFNEYLWAWMSMAHALAEIYLRKRTERPQGQPKLAT
jgi:putative inorganic carbon (hco3(-)) transporter